MAIDFEQIKSGFNLVATAREEGLISTTHLNQGIVESIAVKQLAEHCRKKLAEDIYFLVKKL